MLGIIFLPAFTNHYSEIFTLGKVTSSKCVTEENMTIQIELLRKFLVRYRIGAESAVWLSGWERSFPLSSGSPMFALRAAANFHPRLPVDDVSSFQAGWQPPAPFLQAQNRTKLRMSIGDHGPTLALQGSLVLTLSPNSTAVVHRGRL